MGARVGLIAVLGDLANVLGQANRVALLDETVEVRPPSFGFQPQYGLIRPECTLQGSGVDSNVVFGLFGMRNHEGRGRWNQLREDLRRVVFVRAEQRPEEIAADFHADIGYGDQPVDDPVALIFGDLRQRVCFEGPGDLDGFGAIFRGRGLSIGGLGVERGEGEKG